MLLQIESSFSQEFRIIVEVPDAIVALHAEKRPNGSGNVVMIDRELTAPLSLFGLRQFGITAKGAKTVLGGMHGVVFGGNHAVMAAKQTGTLAFMLFLYSFGIGLDSSAMFLSAGICTILATWLTAMQHCLITVEKCDRLNEAAAGTLDFVNGLSSDFRSASCLRFFAARSDTTVTDGVEAIVSTGGVELARWLDGSASLAQLVTIDSVEDRIVATHRECSTCFGPPRPRFQWSRKSRTRRVEALSLANDFAYPKEL